MARPTTRRQSVRVQVQPVSQAPNLAVAAPMNLPMPAVQHSGLEGLLGALGIGLTIAGKNAEAREKFDFEQGQADEKLGKADVARAKKSRAYADGAFQVATLEAYQEAERKVSERASSDELDKSLPVDDQIRIIDGWMKSELGPLVGDDRAKTLIADKYQAYIDTFAANIVKGQADAHATAAVDAISRQATMDLERTGSFDWNKYFHLVYSQTGDATAANSLLVGVVAQQMEDAAARGEDYEHFRALIPSEVVGPNGEKLPGPMYSPKYRGIIQQSLARAEDLKNHAQRQQYATAEYQARVSLDEDLKNGVPITMDSIAAKGYTVGADPGDHLTPALAAQYIQASAAALAKKKEDDDTLSTALQLRGIFGRWKDVTGMPGGPATEEQTQKMYDGWVQMVLTGSGAPIEQLAGNGLIQDTNLVGTVANLSAQEGMVYGPLKRTMSDLSQAAPGDLTARLGAYKVLKAKGVAGDYVDDDTALKYEVAISAQEAGEKPEGVMERVRTMGDKATADYVAAEMVKLKARKVSFGIPTGTRLGFGEIGSTQAINAPYVTAKYERLVMSALSREVPLEEAKRYAQERITETHVALNIDGKWAVLPRAAVGNPKEAGDALSWYTREELPKLKKALKVPEDEDLSVKPMFDINGRGLSFEITRMGGVGVGKTFTMGGLIQLYRRTFPPKDFRAEAVRRSQQLQQQNNAPLSDPNAPNINPAIRAGHE